MKYDFDAVNDRRNTNSIKYDFFSENGVPSDALPLWIADMDFRVPDCLIEKLKQRLDHGIFGYTDPKPEYFGTVCRWFETRHNWRTKPEGWVTTCTVVFAICSLLRAVTKPSDAVIICQPVYYPFADSILNNGRRLVVSGLKNDNGRYTVDFSDFEQKIVKNKVKAFILCNPHNPVGRVWTKDELVRMGEICLKHGVFVISDEIHSDFVFGNNRHIGFAAADDRFKDFCAVCTAPTKTFNIAGLHISNIYVENDAVREKFKKELAAQGFIQPNLTGLLACQTVYGYGAEWLDGLLEYLEENIGFAENYVKENLPRLKLVRPEGTYLLWLDCRGLGFDDKKLSDFMRNEAKLWLDDGYIFGEGGGGFERINVACPRSVVKNAMERLKAAISRI